MFLTHLFPVQLSFCYCMWIHCADAELAATHPSRCSSVNTPRLVPCCFAADFYPVPETTGTALFTYAMAFGISTGLLDSPTYLPVVERAWGCLTTVSLHPDGTVGNCQPVGWAPTQDFGPEDTSSFCVGQFAMAAAAVAQLAAL